MLAAREGTVSGHDGGVACRGGTAAADRSRDGDANAGDGDGHGPRRLRLRERCRRRDGLVPSTETARASADGGEGWRR